MKKTNRKLGLFGAQVNATIDVKANVKIGRGGGGGICPLQAAFALEINVGFFLPRLSCILVSLLLSFWLLLRSSVS
ncbi:MAG: hypothetical protein LBK06_07995 [Planctomycetaceae bacterium]|jgi:hypothetical protein|nr:hypothetical protein [Planctomycetaceae bacterium]